eukprot:scaffold137_cov192-Alexandrium_tamarense.AAC.13
MTSPALTLGSFLLAFSPSLTLLFTIVFQKPQLVILAVCSAFGYLISALGSSLVWLALSSLSSSLGGVSSGSTSSWGTLLALAVPSVTCQMIVRCWFVKIYFRVEDVIRRSVAKHEEETANDNNNSTSHAETNALQLQLNDLSCSLASGSGYSLLHALFLYGTLLASESSEDAAGGAYGGGGSTGHGGTLYQESCGIMPSLVNGALVAGMFGVLDVIWMCGVFYGMRRRNMYGNGGRRRRMQSLMEGLGFVKGGLDDSLSGGNAALGFVAITHLAAALVLAPNAYEDGCKISLPLLGLVLLFVGIVFVRGVKGHFLPEDQRRRIYGMREGGGDDDGFVMRGSSHHVE